MAFNDTLAEEPMMHGDTRGWAMRHGHGRRLKCLEVRDARESTRGRMAFKRSINQRPRRREDAWNLGKPKLPAYHGIAAVSCAQATELVDWRTVQDAVVHQEEECADWRADYEAVRREDYVGGVADSADEPGLAWQEKKGSHGDSVGSTEASTPSQASPMGANAEDMRHVCELVADALEVHRKAATPTPRPATRWEEALARAKGAAAAYAAAAGVPLGSSRQRRLLGDPYRQEDFYALRTEFLSRYRSAVVDSLSGVLPAPITLKPAPLAASVQRRAVRAFRMGSGTMMPALHGTHKNNHKPIFGKGLLIPGRPGGIRVAHGLAHGQGIYTARLENARLSYGFCSEPCMLVCAVLDDAEKLKVPYTLGIRTVTAESRDVRHVDDAIVVFDASRVVPLYEASSEQYARGVLPSSSSVLDVPTEAAKTAGLPGRRRPAARAARRAGQRRRHLPLMQ